MQQKSTCQTNTPSSMSECSNQFYHYTIVNVPTKGLVVKEWVSDEARSTAFSILLSGAEGYSEVDMLLILKKATCWVGFFSGKFHKQPVLMSIIFSWSSAYISHHLLLCTFVSDDYCIIYMEAYLL